MRRQRYIRDKVDPIQRLIDYQLRSIWRAHQLESMRRQVKLPDTGRSTNTVEDMFINAIDRKYFGQRMFDMMIFDYFRHEYSVRDIEVLTGLDRNKIWRSINRTVTLLERGDIKLEDL